MSQFEQDMNEVSLSIEEAKYQVSLYEALGRLRDNKDFKLLITKDFFNMEAERVVGAKAEAGMMMNEVGMNMLDNIIVSIGGLRQYFIKIQMRGQQAAVSIAEDQQTQEDLRQEALENEE